MNHITELNNKRNEQIDTLIEIDEKIMPKLMKQKRVVTGKISICTTKRNCTIKKIKSFHLEAKR